MVKLDSNLSIRPIKQITAKHYQLFLTADPNCKIIDSYLKRAYQFELVNETDILGVILLIDTRPETIEIVNVAVDESVQNHGLGEKLIEFALAWATKNNYRTIEIGTGSTSFAQLYLYQKCGFRITSVDHDFFVDNYHEPIIENKLVLKDMLRLKKELP